MRWFIIYDIFLLLVFVTLLTLSILSKNYVIPDLSVVAFMDVGGLFFLIPLALITFDYVRNVIKCGYNKKQLVLYSSSILLTVIVFSLQYLIYFIVF